MATTVRERLERALAERQLVRIDRRLDFADREDGFVVALGTKWLLLNRVVDGGHPDGFLAMRRRDVRSVTRDRSFATTVAQTLPSWPPTAPVGIDLDSTAGLLASLEGVDGLIGVEKQRERRALWIGRLAGVDGKRLTLRELDTRARWRKKPTVYKLGELTSVQFGDRYIASLELAASAAAVQPA